MKLDFGSNFEIGIGLAAGTHGSGTHNGASVDHQKGSCASFLIDVGTFATSLNVKVQYSDNDTDWTDEPAPDMADGYPGNDVDVDITGTGLFQLNVPNPRGRYTRAVAASGGNNVMSIINVLGPKRKAGPAATTMV